MTRISLPARLRLPLAALGSALLAACSVPAQLERPELAAQAPLAGVRTAADAAWPEANWWTRYGDAQLDTLETRALEGGPDLAVAERRFALALANADVARHTGGPSLDANAQVQRQRLSEHGLFPTQFLGFTWYSQADLSLNFRYDFDWWGKRRAQIAAAVDEAHAGAAERDAARLALTSGVAQTYFDWLATNARLELTREIVAGLARNRTLVQARVARGLDPAERDAEAARQVAQGSEQQALLEGALAQQRAALAALLGVAPAQLPDLKPRALPSAVGGVPADAALDLVARRPDITAARWRVEAALKRSDALRAEFYPDFSISALVGLSSIDLDRTLSLGSRTANVAPAVHLPLFNGGLRARFGVSRAELDAAAADYAQRVVNAAHDVAGAVAQLDAARARRSAREDQVRAADTELAAARARARQGVGDDRAVLIAGAAALQQRDAALGIDAETLAAEVALVRALGGGYVAPVPSSAPVVAGTEMP